MADIREKAVARLDNTEVMAPAVPFSGLPVMDPVAFRQIDEVSKVMSLATLTPEHLKVRDPRTKVVDEVRTKANCFLVANQAVLWDMNPFSVAPETYVVGGKLAYLGKLVAAVVNSRAGLEGRLWHTFEGKADAREITVHGKFKNEERERTAKMTVAHGKRISPTKHTMWDDDPDQKLIYSCSIRWARRHCPEVVLGILTEDELEEVPTGPAWGRPPAVPPPPGEFNGELGLETDDDLCLECNVKSPNQGLHDKKCSKAKEPAVVTRVLDSGPDLPEAGPDPEKRKSDLEKERELDFEKSPEKVQVEPEEKPEETEEKSEEHQAVEAELGKWITMFGRVKTKKDLKGAKDAFMADYPDPKDPVRQNKELQAAAMEAVKRCAK